MSEVRHLSNLQAALAMQKFTSKDRQSRLKVASKMSAILSCISSQQEGVTFNVLKNVRWAWRTKNPAVASSVDKKYGYPTSMDELTSMVAAAELPQAPATTAEAYLEYLTRGEYTLETRDWTTHIDPTATTPDPPATRQSSSFFEKKKTEKSSPADIHRLAAMKIRDALMQLIECNFVHIEFSKGGHYTCSENFINKFATEGGVNEQDTDYLPMTTLATDIRKVTGDKSMSFTTKYQAFRAAFSRHLTYDPNPEAEPFTVKEDNGALVKYEANERMNPLVHRIAIGLALQDRTDLEAERAEAEFQKLHKESDPKTFAVNRADYLKIVRNIELLATPSERQVRLIQAEDMDEDQTLAGLEKAAILKVRDDYKKRNQQTAKQPQRRTDQTKKVILPKQDTCYKCFRDKNLTHSWRKCPIRLQKKADKQSSGQADQTRQVRNVAEKTEIIFGQPYYEE
jgi:hypothetical protein